MDFYFFPGSEELLTDIINEQLGEDFLKQATLSDGFDYVFDFVKTTDDFGNIAYHSDGRKLVWSGLGNTVYFGVNTIMGV